MFWDNTKGTKQAFATFKKHKQKVALTGISFISLCVFFRVFSNYRPRLTSSGHEELFLMLIFFFLLAQFFIFSQGQLCFHFIFLIFHRNRLKSSQKKSYICSSSLIYEEFKSTHLFCFFTARFPAHFVCLLSFPSLEGKCLLFFRCGQWSHKSRFLLHRRE